MDAVRQTENREVRLDDGVSWHGFAVGIVAGAIAIISLCEDLRHVLDNFAKMFRCILFSQRAEQHAELIERVYCNRMLGQSREYRSPRFWFTACERFSQSRVVEGSGNSLQRYFLA